MASLRPRCGRFDPPGLDRTEATQQLLATCGVPCVSLMERSPAPGTYSVAHMLLSLIRDRPLAQRTVDAGFSLIVRESA
jgi:hypothetical protein